MFCYILRYFFVCFIRDFKIIFWLLIYNSYSLLKLYVLGVSFFLIKYYNNIL